MLGVVGNDKIITSSIHAGLLWLKKRKAEKLTYKFIIMGCFLVTERTDKLDNYLAF